MLERLKSILSFVIRQPKDAAIIGLSLICIFLNWKIGSERRETERSHVMAGNLPTDIKQIVTVYRNRVITQWHEGPTKIEYRDRYLPPEGRLQLVTKEDHLNQVPGVRIKDRGFTLRLGGGVIYSRGFLPEADSKCFYWGRYSALLGITPAFGGFGVSRHIDDFAPFHNLEFATIAGLSWDGSIRIGVGLRINL